MKLQTLRAAVLLALAASPMLAGASSHREAPNITSSPKVDATDFYMFRSYEAGRAGFVTLLANYLPLQDSYGGPNYFGLDPKALYEIHIDNNGNGVEDITFQFRFNDLYQNLTVNANGETVAVPLANIGPLSQWPGALNVLTSYTVDVVRGGRRTGTPMRVTNAADSAMTSFNKPTDNIGTKSIPNYPAYANSFIFNTTIPGCATPGRVFVGQRKEGFVVNLGEVFDLVNTNPAGPRDGERNIISNKNVTTLALEVPITCLTNDTEPVIGGWTTASIRQGRIVNPASGAPGRTTVEGGAWTQVSRLGSPLVNELVIGLPDKDKFNGSEPRNDTQFLTYVTNPTLPVLLNVLFGNDAAAIPQSPRMDLVTAFLTGVPGLNQPTNVTPSEMLRLNTTTPVTPAASQNDLTLLAATADPAGFPNGRRPYDDVVDIELRVAMGQLCGAPPLNCGGQTSAVNGTVPYTDGARANGAVAGAPTSGQEIAADVYLDVFPYLAHPVPGSTN